MSNQHEQAFSHRGSYEEYDHSDEELYVYDQCCDNCRFMNDGICRRPNPYSGKEHLTSDWCPEWKGRTR
jgi:hypothetical protein